MNDDNLVLARVYDTDWEAHLAQGRLEEQGIPSVIDNEIMGSTLPIGFNSIGGVRLMVFGRDHDKAMGILDSAGD